MQKHFIIAIVAGEHSGDFLGAGLMKELKSRIRNIKFVGIPGPLMQREGCEVWYKMEKISVMGIIEIIPHLYRILSIRTDLIYNLKKLRPDVFIGIDAPDFNFFIEKKLKTQGIKTIHYVSPSIWAWRQKRIFKISKSTDLMLTLFPFEKKLYDKFNIPCKFIGHPIADDMPLYPNKYKTRDTLLGISHNSLCLALLPGSRSIEVRMLAPSFLETAKILREIYPNLEIIVPLANSKCREEFEKIKKKITPKLSMYLLDGKAREVMISSDVALLASGTASLECMLAKCPLVVAYRMNLVTFWLAKNLIRTNYIALPNLLAGYELVKELIQNQCKPEKFVSMILPLLNNNHIKKKIYKNFCILHEKIRRNANKQASDAVIELIK